MNSMEQEPISPFQDAPSGPQTLIHYPIYCWRQLLRSRPSILVLAYQEFFKAHEVDFQGESLDDARREFERIAENGTSGFEFQTVLLARGIAFWQVLWISIFPLSLAVLFVLDIDVWNDPDWTKRVVFAPIAFLTFLLFGTFIGTVILGVSLRPYFSILQHTSFRLATQKYPLKDSSDHANDDENGGQNDG